MPGSRLYGRRTERQVLDRLIADVQAGQSEVLILHGETGAGKSMLLDHLAGRASEAGCRVARVTGVQSEMELAFAGLHQLCAPMLSRAEQLPVPQRNALYTAFGIAAGPPPDRFLVGLAVLHLLAGAACERPLICLADDEQWLDRASVQALGFAARRLAADPVGLVFAGRDLGTELAGLPELEVTGLRDDDARALLASALPGPLDARAADVIVAEARGNPLALLELPRGLSPAELAGGFGLPAAAPWAGPIEDGFARKLDVLPRQTRRLLLVAAADPSGDQLLMWRAAGRLDIRAGAVAPAVQAGLVEMGTQLRFRHPLVRSAVYRSASCQDRRAVHAALAEETDQIADPDRRAWHRAKAAAGPDTQIAAELERSAGQAQARGGVAAGAAFLERAVALSADPVQRTARALAAAEASVRAGAFGTALDLLATAEANGSGPLDEFTSANVDLLRGRIAFAANFGSDTPSLLLKAAKRFGPLNLDLARETYLAAWSAASLAGHLAGADGLLEVSRAARALRSPGDPPRPTGLILDGLARLVADGPAAAAPALRQALHALAAGDLSRNKGLRWGWIAATVLWDADAGRAIMARQVQLARDVGALEQMPADLVALAMSEAWRGDFAAAASLIAEADAVAEVTQIDIEPFARMFLASLLGNEVELASLIAVANSKAAAQGQGAAATYAQWVAAISHNGFGRYGEAFAAARQASEHSHPYVSMWALPELIEAGVRTGETRIAADALKRLTETTQACGTDFALGIEARCRALFGHDADDLYREAIDRLGRTELRPELARAHLLYGEWLRRQGRRVDAREQLRRAHELLTAIDMAAFAERARRELTATGETVRKRGAETVTTLTEQEALIARLARDGRTNPEIGAQLFLSARTVEWHLRKIFTKLGISSRRELPVAVAQAA